MVNPIAAAMQIANSHVGYGGPTGTNNDFLNAVGFSPASAASALAGVGAGGPAPGAPAGAGVPAGGGGVAGPDVAMQNLANALNGIRDGINLNIGEVNVTITNTGELANSIKQAVIEAIGGGVNDNSLTTNETSLLNTTSTA
jgi:hypothetical protein